MTTRPTAGPPTAIAESPPGAPPGQPTVLEGRLALVADHLVLALRDGRAEQPAFVLSWYRIHYAASAPAGDLAFVRCPWIADGEAILTDDRELDAALRPRLMPRSWPLADPARAARRATFQRTTLRDGSIEARIAAAGTRIEVAWRDLAAPLVATGRVGADPPWDSSTVLLEAGAWSVRVDGREVPGRAFPNEVWRGWFGRPLSSALVALAEVFREVAHMTLRTAVFLGAVAVTTELWEEQQEDGTREAGCRVELRRTRDVRPPEPPPVPRRDALYWALEGHLWRADLFTTAGSPRRFDAAHYHPTFTGLVPCEREFDAAIVADPYAWIASRLEDLPGMLIEAGHPELAASLDETLVAHAMPAILATIRTTLDV